MSKKFKYTYSALSEAERKEVEYIQSQYLSKDERTLKLDELRRLDRRVRVIPEVLGLTIGIVGLLIFGLGMAMILEWNILIWGVIVCIVGVVPMSIAYFAYKKTYIKLKDKYASDIINLSTQLLGKDEKSNEKEEI